MNLLTEICFLCLLGHFFILIQASSNNGSTSNNNSSKKINWRQLIPKAELSNLTEKLFLLESQNDASKWYTLDLQGMVTKGSKEDLAPKPLLKIYDEVYKKETIRRLLKLYDNYFPEVNKPEVVTAQETKEDWDFLNAILSTTIFQHAKEFLISKELNLTEENFNETIYRIWFEQYSRAKKQLGSSGFEHVFLGEIKRGVSGFHNWIYFGDQERRENLNYFGYLNHVTFGENYKSLITHRFKWRNSFKPISSMFIGTTPEFEMSLFTVCWFIRPNSKCWFTLNGTDFSVQTYVINSNNTTYIGNGYADNAVVKQGDSTGMPEPAVPDPESLESGLNSRTPESSQ